MSDVALSRLADLAGVHAVYTDLSGQERRTSPDTQRALLRALGMDASSDGATRDALQALHDERTRMGGMPAESVISCGQTCNLQGASADHWQLVDTETGALVAEGRGDPDITLPPLPPGLYDLMSTGRTAPRETLIIAAPECAPSVADCCRRDLVWGMTAALYGLRSSRGGSIGTYDDLAHLADIAGAHGADFVGINPIHSLGAEAADVISPYSPSHRCALNSLHVAPAAPDPAEQPDLIDYARAKAENRADLDLRYRHFLANATAADRADVTSFRTVDPLGIIGFAGFETLSEAYGPDWRTWPHALQDAKGRAVADDLHQMADRVDFHVWLQWLTDRHVSRTAERAREAGMGLGLYLDLAVGARRGGAESWAEAASVAEGVSVGAPPDHLSPAGQNWDLTALSPRKLRAGKYDLFRRILRSVLRHAGMIRIDHILGFARSFWIPDDGSPGGYITQPFDALAAIVKIEAQRAGAVVIGEDLGLVPPGFRETMRAHGFYGISVLQYEKTGSGAFRDPSDYDPRVLACFGSHDTPTVAGYRTGNDIGWWERLGWIDRDAAPRLRTKRTKEVALIRSLAPSTGTGEFSADIDNALARSAAMLVSVQLDDVLGLTDAQNLPGTIDEHPNWRRRYPLTVGALTRHHGLRLVSQRMAADGRSRLHAKGKDKTDEH